MARARVEHAHGTVAFASLELRVPAPVLDAFVREVGRFGTVLHEEMRTDEISDQYCDAHARLESMLLGIIVRAALDDVRLADPDDTARFITHVLLDGLAPRGRR